MASNDGIASCHELSPRDAVEAFFRDNLAPGGP